MNGILLFYPIGTPYTNLSYCYEDISSDQKIYNIFQYMIPVILR